MKRSRITFTFIFLLLGICTVMPRGFSSTEQPSPRFGHTMVYDPVNERLLLFGGAVWENSYTFFNDLWSYDPSTYVWTKIEFGHGPSGRFNHMMIYIPERHQIFLFGGFSSSDRVGDTWVYDIEENEWIQLQPRDSPSPRSDAAIAYDEANMVVILFSGYCRDDSHPQDTWVYDFAENNWILMDPEESPKPQYGHYMIYDSLNQREVMYGGHWSIPSTGQHGYSDGVWTYDYPSDTWTKINPATRLPSRYWHTIAYDKDQSKMVVFGGSGGGDAILDDTWFYDLSTNTWDRLTADVNPPKRENSALTYDPVNEKLILFGGLIKVGEPPLNDLWELSTAEGTWRQILPETSPPQEQSEASGQENIPGFPFASITLALILIALSWQYIKKLDTFYHLND